MKPDAQLRELLKGNTPTLILSVLSAGPLHGYGIARALERRSEGTLGLGEGSLYPALRALEADGFIEGKWEGEATGRARKVYAVTASGRAELERRRRSWDEFVEAINTVLRRSLDEPQPI